MRPSSDLPTLIVPTPHTEAVPGIAANCVKIHTCLPKFGVTRDQVLPVNCHKRSGSPLTLGATASPKMPPRPSGTISAQAHLPDDAPPTPLSIQAQLPVI